MHFKIKGLDCFPKTFRQRLISTKQWLMLLCTICTEKQIALFVRKACPGNIYRLKSAHDVWKIQAFNKLRTGHETISDNTEKWWRKYIFKNNNNNLMFITAAGGLLWICVLLVLLKKKEEKRTQENIQNSIKHTTQLSNFQ